MPMVAERFPAQEVYDRAAVEIGGHLAAGRDVAALCEGDPFFFGSFMYPFGRVAERFSVGVGPGGSWITSFAAVSCAPPAAGNAAQNSREPVRTPRTNSQTISRFLAANTQRQ